MGFGWLSPLLILCLWVFELCKDQLYIGSVSWMRDCVGWTYQNRRLKGLGNGILWIFGKLHWLGWSNLGVFLRILWVLKRVWTWLLWLGGFTVVVFELFWFYRCSRYQKGEWLWLWAMGNGVMSNILIKKCWSGLDQKISLIQYIHIPRVRGQVMEIWVYELITEIDGAISNTECLG